MAMLVSFVARGLSSIRGTIFCYSAISSSGIVSILPGFMIRQSSHFLDHLSCLMMAIVTSALELFSQNLLCGSSRLVYALIYSFILVCLPLYFTLANLSPLTHSGLQFDHRF